MKIANKISFSFLIVVIILSCIVGPIVYWATKNVLKNAIYAHLVTSAHSRGRHIETYLAEHKNQTKIIANSIIIEGLLKALYEDSPDLASIMKKTLSESYKYLSDQQMFYEVFIINRDGKIVLSTDESKVGLDKSTDVYFLEGAKGPYIKDAYYSKTTQKESIAISAPVLNDEAGELLGVVVTRSELADLNKITTDRTGLGETGEIYIINKYGYMITESRFWKDSCLKIKVDTENARNCLWPEDKGEHIHGMADITISPDYRGVSILGAHYYIKEMGWGLLAEIDEEEAIAPLVKLRNLFIIVFFLTLIITWLLGWGISKLVTNPIYKLHKGVEILGKGNLDYKVGIDSNDEIGQLSRAFDSMMKSLKKSTTSIENLQKEISEREMAEEKFRFLVEANPYAIIMVDKEGKITLVNAQTENMFGYTRDELLGQRIEILMPERFRHQHQGHRGNFFADPKLRGMGVGQNLSGLCKNGNEIPLEISLNPIKTREGMFVLAAVNNITERKKAEEKLGRAFEEETKSREILTSMLDDNNQIRENLEKKLEELKQTQNMLVQSEKLASLGKLVSDMAHEVNNPLMIISGRAQLALMEDLKNKEVREALGIIMDQCQRAKDIIQRLLIFSKPSKGELHEVNINESLEFVVKLLEHQFSLSDIKIVRAFGTSLPKVKIDEKQIHEVFMNLLKNSAEVMPEGGTITISSYKEGDNVRLDFKDTGSGISEEDMKEIFDPFFTTKERGTGLGLSVCYGIIKSHGGEIRYESALGKGTTAIITLPVERRDET